MSSTVHSNNDTVSYIISVLAPEGVLIMPEQQETRDVVLRMVRNLHHDDAKRVLLSIFSFDENGFIRQESLTDQWERKVLRAFKRADTKLPILWGDGRR